MGHRIKKLSMQSWKSLKSRQTGSTTFNYCQNSSIDIFNFQFFIERFFGPKLVFEFLWPSLYNVQCAVYYIVVVIVYIFLKFSSFLYSTVYIFSLYLVNFQVLVLHITAGWTIESKFVPCKVENHKNLETSARVYLYFLFYFQLSLNDFWPEPQCSCFLCGPPCTSIFIYRVYNVRSG